MDSVPSSFSSLLFPIFVSYAYIDFPHKSVHRIPVLGCTLRNFLQQFLDWIAQRNELIFSSCWITYAYSIKSQRLQITQMMKKSCKKNWFFPKREKSTQRSVEHLMCSSVSGRKSLKCRVAFEIQHHLCVWCVWVCNWLALHIMYRDSMKANVLLDDRCSFECFCWIIGNALNVFFFVQRF